MTPLYKSFFFHVKPFQSRVHFCTWAKLGSWKQSSFEIVLTSNLKSFSLWSHYARGNITKVWHMSLDFRTRLKRPEKASEDPNTDHLWPAYKFIFDEQGRDVNLDIKRIVASRHWCNKLWNAIRFGLLNLGDNFKPEIGFPKDVRKLPFACQAILSRTNHAIKAANESYQKYNFGDGVQVFTKPFYTPIRFPFWLSRSWLF